MNKLLPSFIMLGAIVLMGAGCEGGEPVQDLRDDLSLCESKVEELEGELENEKQQLIDAGDAIGGARDALGSSYEEITEAVENLPDPQDLYP